MNNTLYFVYILASAPFGAIYIGMTNDPVTRIIEHREGRGSRHVWRYKIFRLVYVETFDSPSEAIAREKALKRWRREWKDALIEADNPDWHDRFDLLRRDEMLRR